MKLFNNAEEKISYLKKCAKEYEHSGKSELTDPEFDSLYEEAKLEDPDNEYFDDVGGELDDSIPGDRVPHKIIMGSLIKMKMENFLSFLKTKYQDTSSLSFVLQLKLDGGSCSFLYQNHDLVQILSRGNGQIGISIGIEKAKVIKGVPMKIPYDGEVEVRGEIVKDRQNFYKNFHTSVGGFYKNPRNFATSALMEDDPKSVAKKGIEFVAYEVCRLDFKTETEKNNFLKEQGFQTLIDSTKKVKVGCDHEQIVKAVNYYMESIDRDKLSFDVDGIVFKCDNCDMVKKMGTVNNGRKPVGNVCFKFKAPEKETEVIGVEIGVGRSGKLCPVALLKPIDLNGCMVSRATLHNYGSLIGKDALKIGSRVLIQKKGDIIPQVTKVISLGNVKIDIPTNCPECNSVLNWTENDKGEKVDLICENINCLAQLNKKIDFWFKTIGVKDFGQKTIAKLTDKDVLSWGGKQIISSLVEMYYLLDNDRATEHPFRKYQYLKEQLGEKTYENLLESIHSVKEMDLPTFIEALGIARIGSMSKDIVAIAPTVDKIDLLKVEDIQGISGFGPIKSQNFITEWKARRDEIRRLLKYVTIKQAVKASDKMNGLKFCFTGSFSQGRDELQKIVIDNGGKASSSVGNGVILVHDGVIQGGKFEKAQKDGNKIISEEDFFKMLN